ncbi:NAD(P)/FAD-dependent oxidoreductase [Roseovarius sp. C03]|uniref:NAD(P)/FAD-dependent oxidoreductase n=1 Tax=Roseovarius sp. C03 TaxID=3449222 RepID=UPI003EDB78B0
MTGHGPSISLWDNSAEEPESGVPMPGDVVTDLAIVGGGYTGLATALYAAGKGVRAHVLEAKRIGYGGSGRNVGLVNAGVWYPPAKVRKLLGDTYGPRFIERFGNAPGQVFDLIETHQMRCEVTRTGTIHAAHAARGMHGLRERYDEWQRLGAPVELLSREAVAERTGTWAFHGGLLDHRAGTVNPMGYVRGLARAAQGAGAVVHTGVTATALRRDGEAWVVETDRGTVRARHVVLATNAYTDGLWPGLRDIFTTIEFFQLATPPLGAEMAHVLPGRQGVWDTGTIMTSLRRDAAGRMVLGSMGPVMGAAGRGLSRRWAAKRLERLFPELGKVTFEAAWHGQIAMTPDHLPRIIRLAPGVLTPIGYNGRGITTGTVFGQCMAELIAGVIRRRCRCR